MVGMRRFLCHGVVAAGQAAALLGPVEMRWRAFSRIETDDTAVSASVDEYAHIKAWNFSVPIDHFHNDSRYEPHSDDKFPLRYYLDTSFYKPGGPVIVLASGEADSTDRLPFLRNGIANILARATGGVALVLEHRYYGTSFPVPDLKTANMRFLSTDQALADTAYFAQNIEFPGLEHRDLTAKSAPWIIYGGSYAGAFAAFARKLYPDAFWGAIASSGVTVAIEDYWQYWEAARKYAPGECGPVTQQLTKMVDSILFGGDEAAVAEFKGLFGLEELDDDYVFALVLSMGISGLQNTSWDPEEADGFEFGTYCATVTSDALLFPNFDNYRSYIESLVAKNDLHTHDNKWVNRMLNYIGYIRSSVKSACRGRKVSDCFGPLPQDTSIASSEFRSWMYQVCTQWGFFQTGSGTPPDQLSLVSRKVDLEASMQACKTLFNVTTPPDVESVNKLGGYGFSYPRVAFLDGKQDPWLQATPHAGGDGHGPSRPLRQSNDSEPFYLIDPGVHHWDEYGPLKEDLRFPLPPPQIVKAQKFIVDFVRVWVRQWHNEKGGKSIMDEAMGTDEL